MKGFLLDVSYSEQNGKPVLSLFFKGKKAFIVEDTYEPYFYVLYEPGMEKQVEKKLLEQAVRVEKVDKKILGKKTSVLRVLMRTPSQVGEYRKTAREIPGVAGTREDAITFTRRYLIDKKLVPCCEYEVSGAKNLVFKKTGTGTQLVSTGCFDLEVYNPFSSVRPEKDPIILASWVNGGETLFSTKKLKKKYAFFADGEKALIDALGEKIKTVDIVMGYNSDNFDFPYLKKRARILKTRLALGRDGSDIKHKKTDVISRVKINGIEHFDVYNAVVFLNTIGAVRLVRKTLEDSYLAFFGEEKLDIEVENIAKYWDAGGEKLEKLAEYAMSDAVATYKIGSQILPLFYELSRLCNQTLFDVSRMSASQMIEWLLIKEAHDQEELAPKRPRESEVRSRSVGQIKGGFVKLPTSGLHENLVVLDYKSLYPSIIISHNIDPSTLDCDCCEKPEQSPAGYTFCTKRKGFVPGVLEKVFETRSRVKEELKKTDKKSPEYLFLDARQKSLKVILNATYGYLNFPRARWYSRECAEAITSWGREYIQNTIKEAEDFGFEVVYGDTDSVFLKIPSEWEKLGKEKAKEFVKKINKELPGKMELELEGFYRRGLFVTKKTGKEAAKKKYALLDEQGGIQIKGFEYVRRDWSRIAKKTQQLVLEKVLKEGDPEAAAEVVKKTVEDLRENKIPLKDLVIYTQLKMGLGSYETTGPHVMAAKKAKEAGFPIEEGMLVGYVVVKGGGKISDRSYVLEMAGQREPDAEYYIGHQVLPSVMKILNELGVKEDDLKEKGTQSSLAKWS